MAFVRKKRVGADEYHQRVESRWVEGKSRQKVLVHLGMYPSGEAALKEWPLAIERLRHFARRKREEAERLAKTHQLHQKAGPPWSGRGKRSDGLVPWRPT